MTIVQGQKYWIENPEVGTMLATAELVSANQLSLAFLLPVPIALQPQRSSLLIGDRLLLSKTPAGEYVELFTQMKWTISETEPPNKLPTK